MQVLLLFRGASSCGKSTFIENHGLKPYTLSTDDIRLLYQSPVQNPDGSVSISQYNNKEAWKTLYKILETKMKNKDLCVVDSTNSTESEMFRLVNIASKYKYKVYMIDMTNVPVNVCKDRNNKKDRFMIPDYSIDRMYDNFKKYPIPKNITVIKEDELDVIFPKKLDFTNFKNICIIGSVGNNCDRLKEYFNKFPITKENLYIFIGNYLDTDNANTSTLEYLLSLYDTYKDNIILLEGKSELPITKELCYNRFYKGSWSEEFEELTCCKVNDSISLNDILSWRDELKPYVWFKYHNIDVLASNGGIAKMTDHLSDIPSVQFINGVGNNDNCYTLAETWNKSEAKTIQILSRKNLESDVMQIGKVINIDYGENLNIINIGNTFGTAIIESVKY